MLVRVLGQSRSAGGDDDPGPSLRPMERRLLAALAVRRPDPVSVDSLGAALWEGSAPTSMRKTIQNNVLRLRAKCGRAAIETVEGGYRLGAGLETDVDRFEAAVRAAERATSGRVAAWDAALAWCDDAPLEELGHWPPADARRVRLAEMRQVGVEARWEAALAEGTAVNLVAEVEALVAAAPLRERRWVLLLAAYQQAGRRAEALRAFERARSTLALELGVPPGPELVEAYEAVLRDDDPVDASAHRAAEPDLVSLSDRRRSEALVAAERGDPRAAVAGFVAAAALARDAGDARRFAEAALGATGDGWITSLDATAEAVSLLVEAAGRVPVGPTPLRCRLMARLAVVRSHHVGVAEAEATAARSLAIARALRQPALLAVALHALAAVVWDPLRRDERCGWTDELRGLAAEHPEEPWGCWALPLVARLRVEVGDVAGATEALDQLRAAGAARGDAGALYAAELAGVLRATVAGDWAEARAAAAALRAAGEDVVLAPGDAELMAAGMRGIIDLLAGPRTVPPLAPLDWPVASMTLSVAAWHADSLARADRTADAAAALAGIDVDTVLGIQHDGYWLATLSMLADAAHLADCPPIADVVGECLQPVPDLTIVDPGLCYRGVVAHAAGLAAATCGRHRQAADLLTAGLARHREHGSPWMAARSEEALARLGARS